VIELSLFLLVSVAVVKQMFVIAFVSSKELNYEADNETIVFDIFYSRLFNNS